MATLELDLASGANVRGFLNSLAPVVWWRSLWTVSQDERRRRTAEALTISRAVRADVEREFKVRPTGNPVEDAMLPLPKRREGHQP